MQATTKDAPDAPAPPAQPTNITTVGADGKPQTIAVPMSQNQVDAIVRARSELSDQLINVTERRAELVTQIRSAPEGVARTGLEERIKILDTRIIQLESDLAATGRQLAAAPADLVSFAEQRDAPRGPPTGGGDDFEEGMFMGMFFLSAVFAVVYAFRRWRGSKKKPVVAPAIAADNQRLERLEQGMEAIAIEIERISEGQRFVTKLLSEAPQPIGANARLAASETVDR